MPRSTTRLFVAVAASLLAVVVGGSPANAGSTPTITIVPATVESGESFQVNGAGWFCVDDVELSIIDDATSIVIGTVDGSTIVGGQFSVVFPAPSAPSVYQVSAIYAGSCGGSAAAGLTVISAPTSTTTTTTTVAAHDDDQRGGPGQRRTDDGTGDRTRHRAACNG